MVIAVVFNDGLAPVTLVCLLGKSKANSSQSEALALAADAEEILLVDEVDVLFGSDFYGRTHNQVALLVSSTTEDLLREVWKHREDAASVNEVTLAVKESRAFQALLQQFPSFADIVHVETERMCADLADHVANSKDYIFSNGKVCYRVMDGISCDVGVSLF